MTTLSLWLLLAPAAIHMAMPLIALISLSLFVLCLALGNGRA